MLGTEYKLQCCIYILLKHAFKQSYYLITSFIKEMVILHTVFAIKFP